MAIALEMGTSTCTDDWLYSLMNEMEEDEKEEVRAVWPTIPRVPSTFREVEENKDCYDPMAVSIGPYHHGKTKLEKMEKLKGRLACQLVKESRADAVEIYSEVKKLVGLARGCYTSESTYHLSDEKLAQMMFLDGYFILQFLIHKPENLKMKSEDAALVTRDLFLLENQLPFQVLITLLHSLKYEYTADEKMKLFKDFFKHIRAIPLRPATCRENMSNLLRRLATTIFSTARKFDDEDEPAHLLELFYLQFVIGSENELYRYRPEAMWYRETSWNRYYPVNELRNVGIHFKPSHSSLFIDVQFKPTLLASELHVPPLTIDNSTKPLLLNLAAYEDCIETDDNWFTSYVCFMRSLIDKPEDVKDLRSKGILLTTVGSDQQVVDLFKEMVTNLMPSSVAFIDVKSAIESYYRNTFKRWILRYKGPVSAAIVKYSFLYGFIISGIQAYVSATKLKLGCCSSISPATNATRHF